MALKIYTPGDGETVFDMALAIYKDARGTEPILLLNPGLDLNADSYFGVPIYYDDAITFKKEVFIVTPPSPPREQWISRDYQSIFDVVIQVYGDINDLDKVISQVDTLADPPAGTRFNTLYTQNLLANTLFLSNIVATSGGIIAGGAGGIGVMIIEDTFIVG